MVAHPKHPLEHDKPHMRALQAFEQVGFGFGDIVEHTWLANQFGVKFYGRTQDFDSAKELKDAQLLYMTELSKLKEFLAVEFNMHLASVSKVGYKIIKPEEQTRWAEAEMRSELRKTFSKAGLRLSHIDMGKLDAEQRRENYEAQGRLAFLKSMGKKRGIDRLMEIGSE